MFPGRGWVVAAAVAFVWLLAALPPGAPAPPTGWNGANPFNCELQMVGSGTAFPHPAADPFCVDFDKRRQNVTDLGAVDFLSPEPAPRAVYGAGKPVPSCSSPNGSASTRRLGVVTVGDTERRVRDLLGAPGEVRRGFLRYCLNDHATFLVGQAGDRSGDAGGAGAGDEPTALVYTDSQAYRYLRVRPGLGASALKRRWRHATVRLRMGKVAI